MTKVSLLLLSSIPAFGATCTITLSTGSINNTKAWSATVRGDWSCGHVPTAGDDVVASGTGALLMDTAVSLGSGGTNTWALKTSSATVAFRFSAVLTAKGGVGCDAPQQYLKPCITATGPGAGIIIDTTGTASTRYAIKALNGWADSNFQTIDFSACTRDANNPTRGYTSCKLQAVNPDGAEMEAGYGVVKWTDMKNLGGTAGWHDPFKSDLRAPGGGWRLENNFMENFQYPGCNTDFYPQVGSVIIVYQYNRFVGGGGQICFTNSSVAKTTGTWELIGNVWGTISYTDWKNTGVTIRNNYWADVQGGASANANSYQMDWEIWRIQREFVPLVNATTINGMIFGYDLDHGNPHGLGLYSTASSISANYLLSENTGVNDGGDDELPLVGSGTGTVTIRNVLINASGEGRGRHLSLERNNTSKLDASGVTLFGMNPQQGEQFGFFLFHSTEQNKIQSLQNSMVVANPSTWGSSWNYLFLGDSCSCSTTTGTAPDYNLNFPATTGNKYGATVWTGTAGTHDVVLNPQFVNYKRSLVTWPTGYLGIKVGDTINDYLGSHTVTQWANGAPYVVGDYYIDADPDSWWGQPVLYRATRNHTASSAVGATGTRPRYLNMSQWTDGQLVDSTARTSLKDGSTSVVDWRWYSEYGIWQIIAESTVIDATYGDIAGQSHQSPAQSGGRRIAQTIYDWVVTGFTPQDRKVCVAGAGGATIGVANCPLLAAAAL